MVSVLRALEGERGRNLAIQQAVGLGAVENLENGGAELVLDRFCAHLVKGTRTSVI